MVEVPHISRKQYLPPWGVIGVLLAIGIVFVGFGNADRLFWRWTSHGAQLPGLVVENRAYRASGNTYLTYVPKVAFRAPDGQVRVMEVKRGSVHYDFDKDTPVWVLWRENSETIAIDLPFQRKLGTAIVLWLFTAIGLTCWLAGIWLIIRRIYLSAKGLR